jgi:hypothetical protein
VIIVGLGYSPDMYLSYEGFGFLAKFQPTVPIVGKRSAFKRKSNLMISGL